MGGFFGKIAGFFLILLVFWAGLLNHGFGCMIDPAASAGQWWREYLSKTAEGYLGVFAFLFLGVYLMFGPTKRWRWKLWTPIEVPEHFLDFDGQKSFLNGRTDVPREKKG